MDQIMNKIMVRIKYWFQNGSFAMSSVMVDQTKSSTPNASKRSIITNFADAEFYYQMIIRFSIEDLENCDVIIKKYDPAKIDELNGGMPIWTIELTNDKKVKVDDVKEDFIIKKISEQNDDISENPDENKIKTPKSEQPQPAQNTPQGGMPPAQGGMPPAQGGMPPAQGGMPPAPAPQGEPAF
jgi:hypothetical protein